MIKSNRPFILHKFAFIYFATKLSILDNLHAIIRAENYILQKFDVCAIITIYVPYLTKIIMKMKQTYSFHIFRPCGHSQHFKHSETILVGFVPLFWLPNHFLSCSILLKTTKM